MEYAALVRPVVDRVFVATRIAARPRVRKVLGEMGLSPSLVISINFGLMARPLPADGFAAITTYSGGDMTSELEEGVMIVDEAGTWHLTDLGRSLALATLEAIAEGAQELWETKHIATMPGLDALPRLNELLEKLLKAGAGTGGPAFRAVAPIYAPAGASLAMLVTSQLGALRHHRGDAHRAAWAAGGLTLAELQALAPESAERQAIEDDTNRRDAPIYAALTEPERWEFLALLGALPG